MDLIEIGLLVLTLGSLGVAFVMWHLTHARFKLAGFGAHRIGK